MRVAGRGASRARVIDPYGAREVSKWMPARSVVESREIVTKDHPAELPLAGRRLETCELAVVIAHGASLAKNSGLSDPTPLDLLDQPTGGKVDNQTAVMSRAARSTGRALRKSPG
jgi:hypothetical protein